jgi:hypothetical protein
MCCAFSASFDAGFLLDALDELEVTMLGAVMLMAASQGTGVTP